MELKWDNVEMQIPYYNSIMCISGQPLPGNKSYSLVQKYYQYPSGEHLDQTIISISMESTYSEMQISNYNLIKHKEY